MNIAFLNQGYLIQREVAASLRRLPGARVVAIDIVAHPVASQARQVAEILRNHGCGVLFTVNEWGMDAGGTLWEFIDKSGIIHINWSVDDPFFEETINVKKYRPSRRRFDFVSDKGYLQPLRERGYNAHFLPLAVDPAFFHPDPSGPGRFEYDAVFVGNSYLNQMDEMLKKHAGFIDAMVPFLGSVVRRYLDSVEHDVEGHIAAHLRSAALPADLSFEKAHYIAKHTAGYLGRKRIILALVGRFPGFRVFGEKGWLKELPPERLGTAKYYDSLCEVYRKAKITVDINRVVIRNGFTQRVFDAPASGGFVITSAKPVVGEFFETAGPAQEIAVFRSLAELIERIDYYLAHEEERRAIARRGMKKVLGGHTYDHRIAEIFRVIQGEMAAASNTGAA